MRGILIVFGLLVILTGGAISGAQFSSIDLEPLAGVSGGKEFLLSGNALLVGGGLIVAGLVILLASIFLGRTAKPEKRKATAVRKPGTATIRKPDEIAPHKAAEVATMATATPSTSLRATEEVQITIPPADLTKGISPSAKFEFLQGKAGVNGLKSGWSPPEPWGTWSEGAEALIELTLPTNMPKSYRLVLDAQALVVPQNPRRKIQIQVGDDNPFSVTFSTDTSNGAIVFPARTSGQETRLKLKFLIEDPISPRSLGMNDDGRLLGIAVRSLEVFPMT